MSEQQKSGRVKRSRLGRGLSALVDVSGPVVVETAADKRSDNLIEEGSGGRGGADPSGASSASGVDGGVGLANRGGAEPTSGAVSVQNANSWNSGGQKLKNESSAGAGSRAVDGVVQGVDDGIGNGTGGGGVVEVSVGLIVANRDQPRRVFDEGALAELAGSIAAHGLMQPIMVRRVMDSAGGEGQGSGGIGGGTDGVRYELIAGERRWRASQLAGLTTIPVVVRDVDDATSAQLALIENVQREDLSVIELAQGYRVLSDRYSMTQEQIAQTVGVSRSSVANIVRLLDLPDEVRSLIGEGVLSLGHAKVLLSLGVPEKQRKFAARCIKEGWNVRELSRACADEMDGVGDADDATHRVDKEKNPTGDDRAVSVLRDLERRVGEELGTRVKIRTDKSRTRGRVVIEFYDLDQFDGLLGRLGVKMDG